MTKTRTMPVRHSGPTRDEEFHQKLEKGAMTAAVHRQKVHQDEKEAQHTTPDRAMLAPEPHTCLRKNRSSRRPSQPPENRIADRIPARC
jgi:hypothetical protein